MNRPPIRAAALAALGILTGALSCPRVQAEELRAIIAGNAALAPESPEGTRLAMGVNEAVTVSIPKDSPFIQGFEIELKLPAAAISAPGGFVFELWYRIDPAPERNRYGYRGERILTRPLPARAGVVIQIPVRKDHYLKQGPYAILIPAVVEPKDFPFLFRLVPIAKGYSAEVEASQLQVRIKPLLTDEGALGLRLRYPEDMGEPAPVLVTVDDHKVDPGSLIFLKAGNHRLLVSSERYRDENRSFAIEQGRVLELPVELQDTSPVVVLEAPDSASITLDGQKLDHVASPQMKVEAGDHTVTCKIGDYTITRKFTASRDRTYRLVLMIDLQIQEAP
jgi:hypothetical protein